MFQICQKESVGLCIVARGSQSTSVCLAQQAWPDRMFVRAKIPSGRQTSELSEISR
jgi:hypothetical protein